MKTDEEKYASASSSSNLTPLNSPNLRVSRGHGYANDKIDEVRMVQSILSSPNIPRNKVPFSPSPSQTTLAHAQYDVAARFLRTMASRPNAPELLAPWSPAEEKTVRRKVRHRFG